MRHVPHLYLPGPWESDVVPLTPEQDRHLRRVLRLAPEAAVSYTDGAGRAGEGTLDETGVRRGSEQSIERPSPPVALAVAPPRSTGRQRFVVEKLAELGVDRLYWLETRHTEGRPKQAKARAWARAALEQSRGAWLLGIQGPVSLAELPGDQTLYVAERETLPPPTVVDGGILVVGPEAGLAEGEVPDSARRVGLGARVLRVETAAVVGATVLLDRSGRLAP